MHNPNLVAAPGNAYDKTSTLSTAATARTRSSSAAKVPSTYLPYTWFSHCSAAASDSGAIRID